jgi:hypothetical protein
MRPSIASSRASNVVMSASFWALVRAERSGAGLTHTLIQIRRRSARPFLQPESIRRDTPVKSHGLSNYQYCLKMGRE